jgi:hypothetical protein
LLSTWKLLHKPIQNHDQNFWPRSHQSTRGKN